MMTPPPVPSSPPAAVGEMAALAGHSSAILQKTIEIQNEIRLINVHNQHHILTKNNEVKNLDASCKYCQAFQGNVEHIRQEASPTSKQMIKNSHENSILSNNVRIFNELERIVDISGRRGQVTVPRNWAGKRVKVTLLED